MAKGAAQAGIYRILNTANGKAYIGSSIDIAGRIAYHASLLRLGRHTNRQFQEDWDTYGPLAFTVETLEVVDPDDAILIEAESRHLEAAHAAGLSYNRRGQNPYSGRHPRPAKPDPFNGAITERCTHTDSRGQCTALVPNPETPARCSKHMRAAWLDRELSRLEATTSTDSTTDA